MRVGHEAGAPFRPLEPDLDGAAIPPEYVPNGFVYSLDFNDPSSCLFEDVGADVM